MKKLAAFAGATLLSLGGGGVALAEPYPPEGASLALVPSTVVSSATFTATFTGCDDGETVTFSLVSDADTATCAGGLASVTLTAPAAVGEYPVTATGATSGATATAALTVVAAADDDDGDDGAGAGQLPATGSDNGATMQIAGGALIAGLALAGVAYKRRHPQTA